ncbi:MAG: hypothetical protein AAGA30_19700, partial [Planctomycetota bacterium]
MHLMVGEFNRVNKQKKAIRHSTKVVDRLQNLGYSEGELPESCFPGSRLIDRTFWFRDLPLEKDSELIVSSRLGKR